MKVATHEDCNGTGKVLSNLAGTSRKCYTCQGLGMLNSQYHHFASERGMKMAKTRRNCFSCNGKKVITYPEDYLETCWKCQGDGKIVTEAHPGDILPEGIGICNHLKKELWSQLFAEMNLKIVRADRKNTFVESFLGVGLYSCTDYGKAWSQSDDEVLKYLRGDIEADSTQWIKIIDRDSRVIAQSIIVRITRDGYSVVASKS